ncbi:MAG: serine/threonine-protein kinase [Planctomycetota bacterium]
MTSGPSATNDQLLDEQTRAFVRRALSAGVATLDEIKTVVSSLMVDDVDFSPQRLADGLVGAGTLTQWQANKLLAGKSKGFFLGTYKLLRPLGKGGMGMVYLGEHHVMKRQMALKIMPPNTVDNKRRIERFKEEARASAQIDHPNVVQAIDFNESGGKFYIVMEYVDGIDLHQAVVSDGVMSIDAAIDAIYQAAQGLSQAHERGIVHRDIKPSNLMLRSDGVVKVSDMGLARVGYQEIAVKGEKTRLTGTADFIAPEQALNSKTVDARADIYSLGCTLYFLLAGRPPYSGKDVAQRLAKHQTEPIPDVRQRRDDCPAPVANLIARMMAKKPSERPTSAVDLISQLERIRGGAGKIAGNQQQLADLASTTDTIVDDQVFEASLLDTSFADSNDSVDLASPLAEFDFGSIPNIETTAQPSTFRGPAPGQPSNQVKPLKAGGQSSLSSRAPNQTLLLGIGLTVAVFALLTVLAMATYHLLRPLDAPATKIKATESGEGRSIIIMK